MANAQWPDQDRAEQYINNNPGRTTDLLASLLDQAVVDALYAQMFPPATAYQKKIALSKTKRLLMNTGYGSDSGPVQSIDSELATL